MKKNEKENNLLAWLKSIYIKLLKINDTPQRIALGLGLGVFSGILPGTGLIVTLFLAWVFRLNRASALLGALLTNTWLSIVTFILSIKIGSTIMGLNWQDVYRNWLLLMKGFHWADLFKTSILQIILPVAVGYFIVAFFLGLMVYLITIIVLKFKWQAKYENKSRVDLSR